MSSAGRLAAAPGIEPGLEEAVAWKWDVAPAGSDEWGMKLPEKAAAPAAGEVPAVPARPATYEVRKGDALVKIARKFNMTVAQLKQHNGLKGDLIRIGDVLRIPTHEDLLAMAPPPVAKPVGGGDEPGGKAGGRPGLELPPTTVKELELQTVLVQVFLDREMFSQGPVDGEIGPMFESMRRLYLNTHPELVDLAQLKEKALEAVDYPYANYTLREEDFRFIRPPKSPASPAATLVVDRKAPSDAEAPAAVRYEDLAGAGFLPYADGWEFVAERFHCQEAFLRRLNSHIDVDPVPGTIFQVPKVIPFEIEHVPELPLQPEADPRKPVSAAVVKRSMLEVTRAGRVIAVVPLASARPGLHGRGSWTVLDAIARPRIVTRREPREAPEVRSDEPPRPGEFLAPGPNNPVGVVWINLAKAKSTEPLRYGLHGTSIPGQMNLEGIGGLRLANWDIARIVRLLPAGTPLQWRDK
ncbi:L,D-transpeptidase family protein [Luteolibacter marinus]|uniref:L,D-transpeptidase family protein n=1 Tax=Luteolibacter marinus TaxID=2776705 RepID=UPI0018685AC5|nr:LysM peptidoglycan-binding domain-containing protein [Luteolibacter marinus]